METYRRLLERLDRLRSRRKRLLIAGGAATGISLAIGFWFLLTVFEAVFRFNPFLRTMLVSLWSVSVLVFCVRRIGMPLYSLLFRRDSPGEDTIALDLGKVYPFRDRLANAIQVYRDQKERAGTSGSLAEASLESAYRKTLDIDMERAAPAGPVIVQLRLLLAVVVLAATGTAVFHEPLFASWGRLRAPRTEFRAEAPFKLMLLPGNMRVIQGDTVEITIIGEGRIPDTIGLMVEEDEETEFRKIELDPPYRHTFPSLRNGFRYYAQAEGVRSDEYRVDVVQRPMVRTFQIIARPPEYSGWPVSVQDPDDGDMDVLAGTRIDLSATANKPLAFASLAWSDGEVLPLETDSRRMKGSFRVKKAGQYGFSLGDTLGLTNTDPITYRVQIIPDYVPMARIPFPGENGDLDESMTASLTLEGEDDFGISSCGLRCEILTGDGRPAGRENPFFIPVPIHRQEPPNVLINFNWELDTLDLLPEDAVAYTFEVTDNDRVSGPKTGKSETYLLRFPSIDEIFEEVDAVHDSQAESLEEMIRESREFRESLDRVAEELKGGQELEWEEKQNLETLLEERREADRRIEELRTDMSELVDRMQRNDLLEMETLEKYLELQELYREMSDPAFLEAMNKLQEMMNQMDRNLLQQAMQKFQMSEEAFQRSIERTLSLLKRLQIEQKTDELVRRMEALVQKQEEINRDIASGDKDADQTADREGEAGTDAMEMQDVMKDLQQRMEDIPGMPDAQLAGSMTQMEDLLSRLREMEGLIRSGSSEAGQKSMETMESMRQLEQMLKQMQKDLKENQKEKIERALRRNAGRLLQLSGEQEQLILQQETGRTGRDEALGKQMSLLSGVSQVTDSLSRLATETFMITPAIGQAIGRARIHMRNSLEALSDNGDSGAHQTHAMAALNESVLALLDALRRLQEQQSGLGAEMFFQQMEQMAQQQMGLNSQTLDLLNRGSLSLEQQAAMARMAAEQEMLRKRLESLMKEYGSRKDLLGRLDRMAEDMEKVMEDLKRQDVKPETVQRQQRILSRLLDAQRSLQQRDYSRERNSRTGRDVIRRSPEAVPAGTGRADEMRRDILRMAREGYTKTYQELIRQYYEILSRMGK